MKRRAALALGLALGVAAGPAAAADRDARGACAAPPGLAAVGPALVRSAARVAQRALLTIVAVGSSSTQGVGASDPDRTYPSRLDAELKARFPGYAIRVINRGKGGEDAPEELARLDRDVVALHPDLVIWQVGTNAVLRRDDLTADDALIGRGVALLKAGGSDVVLMDLQYAPRVIARRGYAAMERLIADAAASAGVGLFRRFEIMKAWHEARPGDAPPMIGPDGLHMTDRGYGCIAADLAEALAANWRAQRDGAPGSGAPRIAGLDGVGHVPPPPAFPSR